ncbi:MAG: rod shape-determining protein RodA [candidate division Zixibacteria bacterium]
MILNYKELDWQLIVATLLLSFIGVAMIMSAQHFADSTFKQTYYIRQLIWLAIALAVFAAVIHFPFRMYDIGSYLLYGFALLLLVLVLFVGYSRMGSFRWLSIGPMNFAPSDLAKLALIFVLARYFAYTKLPPTSKRRLAFSAVIMMLPVLLILKQPDLGTSMVFPVILFAMWYWSGLSPFYLLLILSPLVSILAASHWIAWAIYLGLLFVFLFVYRPGLIFGILIFTANLATGSIMPLMWNRLAEYQKLRILTFLDPGNDPRGAGYQIIQSKIAIGSGGIWGKGFMEGSQARLDFLPERHTDFVFSVLGEEFGLWGSIIVLGLFAFIFVKAIRIAGKCRSKFASNIVIGATTLLLFQFLVNVGMTLGFMPVTGLPLPFLSYGGTSLVLAWSLIGLIVAAGYRWQEY